MMSEDFDPSTHPPLPPTTEDDRTSWLRLLRSRRVGPATFHRLMIEHGSASAALLALPDIARAAGVKDYSVCPEDVVAAEITKGHALGARLVAIGETAYPKALTQISDAPPLLWVIGKPETLAAPLIAIVGARNASSLGLRMARNLAGALSERGYLVVSGLARGIDAAAHGASLERGTVAVMAGGVDVMYPAENTHLAQDIIKTGARVSEMPIGLVPQARHFPSRNRIISGMAQGVVVIEAAAKSGSLITARNALDQAREVMAVPGHPFDIRAAGCNLLIRDGASLVRNADDVIQALPKTDFTSPKQPELALDLQASTRGPSPHQRRESKRKLATTAALHTQILDRLGPSPLAEDQLIRDLSAPAAQVSPALTDLEIQGQITRHPGGLVSLS